MTPLNGVLFDPFSHLPPLPALPPRAHLLINVPLLCACPVRFGNLVAFFLHML